MSNTPIKMNKLRMIMRLREQGQGLKQISRMSMTSRNTVKKYLKRQEELSMSYEDFCRRFFQRNHQNPSVPIHKLFLLSLYIVKIFST
jgi:hypothetical protein